MVNGKKIRGKEGLSSIWLMKQDDMMFRIELAHCMYDVCTISKGPACSGYDIPVWIRLCMIDISSTEIMSSRMHEVLRHIPLLAACNLGHDRMMYEEWVYSMCEVLRRP